jgi:hypothetical protein
MNRPIDVWACCNGGVIKKLVVFKQCLARWQFMSWFHRINGGDDIDFTAEAVGRRVLRVHGMDKEVLVRVQRGRIVVEEAE